MSVFMIFCFILLNLGFVFGGFPEMILSLLEFARCRSVVFVCSDSKSSFNLISLQKPLSSNENLYLSSFMKFPELSEALRRGIFGWRKPLIILEYDEKHFLHFFPKLSREINISSSKWLILAPNLNLTNFKHLKIPLSSEVTVAAGSPETGFSLTEIYDVRDKRLAKPLGEWAEGGVKVYGPMDFYSRRRDLGRIQIRVLSNSEDPCSSASFDLGIAAVVLCIHKNIWLNIAETLNATTEFVVDPTMDVNSIQHADVDLTLRSAPMNTEYYDSRSYMWPSFGTKLEVLASYDGQEVEWTTYVNPFSRNMWVAILAWIVVSDLIIVAAEYSSNQTNPLLDYYSKYSFFSFYAFCNQGIIDCPKFLSYRVIVLLIFVVPVVLLPGYSAVLTSFVTIQVPRKPFRNLEELSRQSDYSMGWHWTFPFELLFNKNDTRPLNRALLTNNVLAESQMPRSDTEAVEKMCREKFVFISNVITVVALRPKCQYFKLDRPFFVVFTSMEYKRNHPYGYLFNRCERYMHFTGIQDRVNLETVMKLVKLGDFEPEVSAEATPITMENCALPFAVLFFSFALSGFFLLLEIIVFKWTRPKIFYIP